MRWSCPRRVPLLARPCARRYGLRRLRPSWQPAPHMPAPGARPPLLPRNQARSLRRRLQYGCDGLRAATRPVTGPSPSAGWPSRRSEQGQARRGSGRDAAAACPRDKEVEWRALRSEHAGEGTRRASRRRGPGMGRVRHAPGPRPPHCLWMIRGMPAARRRKKMPQARSTGEHPGQIRPAWGNRSRIPA